VLKIYSRLARFSSNSLFSFALIVAFTSCSGVNNEFDLSDARGSSGLEQIYPKATLGNLQVPVGQPKRAIIIRGTCVFTRNDDDFEYPARFVRLVLLKDSKVAAETTTSDSGTFVFSNYLESGKYLIVVESEKYSGETALNVDKNKHEGLVIKAHLID